MHILFSILFNVPLSFSVSPLHIEVVVICFILHSLGTSLMHPETNCIPKLLRISSGTPNALYMLTKPSTTSSVVMDLCGTASGYLVV